MEYFYNQNFFISKEMMVGSVVKFFNDIILFFSPMVLSRLIEVVDERSQVSLIEGYILSGFPKSKTHYYFLVLLFVFNTVEANLINHYFDIGFKIGLKLKVLLMDSLYKKALMLSFLLIFLKNI